ncbi:MAG: hypothetical protein HY868_24305 [Chloroflexi bacterium]|nr:hypothetical protein [Chloroflexota bacterium]
MAVLKKHGAELLRVRREKSMDDDPDIAGRVYERAYMSDGTVLEKTTTQWHGRSPTRGGWKIRGKVKAGKSPADIAAYYKGKGWVVELMTHLSPSRPIMQDALAQQRERFNAGESDQTQFAL